MYNDFKQPCLSMLSKMPILRTYVQYKKSFQLDSCLTLLRSNKLRIILSKVRLSSHCLAIENGHHTKPNTTLEDRVCWLCKKNLGEDECHF